MRQLISYELEEDEIVLVEIDGLDEKGGISPAGRDEANILKKAAINFEEALDKIRPVTEKIIQKFGNLNQDQSTVEVEFGLKMNADSRAIIVSAGVEANFKITITWDKKGH